MLVFIDTNVYLTFIELSDEKNESLAELRKKIEKTEISLVFPKITQDELSRNIPLVTRRNCADLYSAMPKKVKLPVSIRNKSTQLEHIHKQYLEMFRKTIQEYEKSVEKYIQEEIEPLSKLARNIHEDSGIISLANERRLKGNPPGKSKGPLGDEIEWELLLNKTSEEEDLVIISNDGDWKDQDKERLNKFLEAEWKQRKKTKIKLFTTLGKFINTLSPEKVSKKKIESEEKTSMDLNRFFVTTTASTPTLIRASDTAPGIITGLTAQGAAPAEYYVIPNDYVQKCDGCGIPNRKTSLYLNPITNKYYCYDCARRIQGY